MKWITRHRPKIDRLACPWLIRRFIDREAEFIYVPDAEVKSQAEALGATPFDVPEVEFTHYGEHCTFDYFLKKYKLQDPALQVLADIVRGADTDRHHLAQQSSGLWAISAGLAHNFKDDRELLEKGMLIYDALYSWAKFLRHERHTQNPVEQLLQDVYNKVFEEKKRAGRRIPKWVLKLKSLLEKPIDNKLTLNELARELDLNAEYLSREFAKYFDNLTFSQFVKKRRVEKAIELLNDPIHSLTEIAYLTGFFDQSHFQRVFKELTGVNPSAYRKNLQKSKTDTKG